MSRQLERGDDHWQVITIVRDPVARNLSSFFQTATTLGVDLQALRRASEEETARAIGQSFLQTYSDHDIPLTWLDDEIRAVFDIDVYATPFPAQVGYARYSSGRADLLLLRFEDMSTVFGPAMREFLGRPAVPLLMANASRTKRFGDLYEVTRRHIVLPEEYLDRMYRSRYARHYYSQKELELMCARWQPGREGQP